MSRIYCADGPYHLSTHNATTVTAVPDANWSVSSAWQESYSGRWMAFKGQVISGYTTPFVTYDVTTVTREDLELGGNGCSWMLMKKEDTLVLADRLGDNVDGVIFAILMVIFAMGVALGMKMITPTRLGSDL